MADLRGILSRCFHRRVVARCTHSTPDVESIGVAIGLRGCAMHRHSMRSCCLCVCMMDILPCLAITLPSVSQAVCLKPCDLKPVLTFWRGTPGVGTKHLKLEWGKKWSWKRVRPCDFKPCDSPSCCFCP